MSIDPVKIPQNVYVEDRIIGPITLRQIMIVMICTGISYGIWAAMKASGPVSTAQTTMAWMPTAIGAMFAFIKINGISLLRIVLLSLERIDKPSKRYWTPRQGIYVNIVTKPPKKKKQPKPQEKKTEKGAQLEELSRVLDLGPDESEEEADVAVEQVAEQQPEAPAKPVNKNKISAEPMENSIDDIQTDTPKQGPTLSDGLLRDISPPSHA